MTKAQSTRLSGVMIRSSLTLLIDWDTQFWERILSKEFSKSKERLLIQVTSASHSFKLRVLNLMQTWASSKVRPFTRIAMFWSGFAFGRSWAQLLSQFHPVSTFSKCMQVTVLPVLTGFPKTGLHQSSPNSFRTAADGSLQTTAIATITTTWISSIQAREVLRDLLTHSTCLVFWPCCRIWTGTTSLAWPTTKTKT